MSKPAPSNSYFTQHLFRAGLGCPVKLYYKANDYPEDHSGFPFIAHNRLNRNQFKALVRSLHPGGVHIDVPGSDDADNVTTEYLRGTDVIVYDAVIVWQDVRARIDVLEKKGDEVKLLYVQTKAFNPYKHRLTNHQGQIYPKWADYLTDIAFQMYVLHKLYPRWKIRPYLVLPNKVEHAGVDHLFEKVKSGGVESVPVKEEGIGKDIPIEVEVGELIQSIWEGESFSRSSFEGQNFGQVVEALREIYFSGEKYPVAVGSKCKDCEFRIEDHRAGDGVRSGFMECWKAETGTPENTSGEMVFDLIGPGTTSWMERGYFFQHQIPEDEVATVSDITNKKGKFNERQRQALQILKSRGVQVPEEIIKPRLFDELRRWEYPIHFLDFEAGNYTLPIKRGRNPYHLVVFQFSCHSLQKDGTWTHHDWIDNPGGGYPNYECIRQLQSIEGLKEGTVVQYSEFERNALKIIRKELLKEEGEVADARELAEWIEHFITRRDSNAGKGPYLADLGRLVRNYYYNTHMGNSLSIKDVVQAILTKSSDLKRIYSQPYESANFDPVVWWQPVEGQKLVRNPYSILGDLKEGLGVRRGSEAMYVYGKLLNDKLTESERLAYVNALLKYCELDTLSMLMIYQYWEILLKDA